MTSAPGDVDSQQLQELSIRVRKPVVAAASSEKPEQ
jgi:hypothetical protein